MDGDGPLVLNRIGIENRKNQANKARLHHLIAALASKIDVRGVRRDVRVGVVPADNPRRSIHDLG